MSGGAHLIRVVMKLLHEGGIGDTIQRMDMGFAKIWRASRQRAAKMRNIKFRRVWLVSETQKRKPVCLQHGVVVGVAGHEEVKVRAEMGTLCCSPMGCNKECGFFPENKRMPTEILCRRLDFILGSEDSSDCFREV